MEGGRLEPAASAGLGAAQKVELVPAASYILHLAAAAATTSAAAAHWGVGPPKLPLQCCAAASSPLDVVEAPAVKADGLAQVAHPLGDVAPDALLQQG